MSLFEFAKKAHWLVYAEDGEGNPLAMYHVQPPREVELTPPGGRKRSANICLWKDGTSYIKGTDPDVHVLQPDGLATTGDVLQGSFYLVAEDGSGGIVRVLSTRDDPWEVFALETNARDNGIIPTALYLETEW